jgi:integrase
MTLRWRDVRCLDHKLIVSRALSADVEADSPKGGRFREVPLPDQAAAGLDRLSDAAEVPPLRFHDLRHTHGSGNGRVRVCSSVTCSAGTTRMVRCRRPLPAPSAPDHAGRHHLSNVP